MSQPDLITVGGITIPKPANEAEVLWLYAAGSSGIIPCPECGGSGWKACEEGNCRKCDELGYIICSTCSGCGNVSGYPDRQSGVQRHGTGCVM